MRDGFILAFEAGQRRLCRPAAAFTYGCLKCAGSRSIHMRCLFPT